MDNSTNALCMPRQLTIESVDRRQLSSSRQVREEIGLFHDHCLLWSSPSVFFVVSLSVTVHDTQLPSRPVVQ